jgi:ubiquinone biosynthesis protein UbiJ
MGKNTRYRRHLEGQKRALAEHLAKIEAERAKPNPDMHLIADWEKTIRNIKRQIEKLERRLKR